MTNFNEMGKVELRAACKEAGISYSKLNNDGMRAALELHYSPVVQLSDADKAQIADEAAHRNAGSPGAPESVIDWDSVEYDAIRDMNCPSCGIHLDNGVLHYTDEAISKKGMSYTPSRTLHEDGQQTHTWSCMGCGAQFGADHGPYIAHVPAEGLKIEKDRPEQNGIKRPSIGGKCREIWDALDEYVREEGAQPDSKLVKALAEENGWNRNNASIEFYQWRKFHGIKGR